MKIAKVCAVLLLGFMIFSVSLANAAGKNNTAALVDGNGRFAFDLFRQISGENPGKNVLISPFSISTALAMTYAGARGDTETQMARTLHFRSQDALHPAFMELDGQLFNKERRDYKLYISNALWGQNDYRFSAGFKGLIKTYYDGGFRTLDFVKRTEASRKTINKAVADATAGRIKDLLGKGDVTRLTRLVLTDAVYFKGVWESRFNEKETATAPFYKTPEVKVNVQMMHQRERFRYAELEYGLKVLELPYKGGDLSMVVLLPDGGLTGLVPRLTYENIRRWLSALYSSDVEVSLPRFKFDARYYLNKDLAYMGMPDAFDEMKANFSGMTGNKGLYISRVIHQADVEVTEEGTEAAAATAVVMGTKSLPHTVVFNADHPFVFLILHKNTGAVLFVGSVLDPK